MHHFQLNYSYTASLCEALILSTRTNVSQFVSQYDVSREFLLSIGKVICQKLDERWLPMRLDAMGLGNVIANDVRVIN